LDGLERETRLKFPPRYREFLRYQHFVTVTELGVRFERHLVGEWRETLRTCYFTGWPRDRIIDRGLLPFGAESLMDAGPVCFDTRSPAPANDWPVVFWDHEWVGGSREVQPMFSSCEKMFQCLRLVAESDVNFVYHDEDDDDALLVRKRELLRQFLAADPDGAGGPAREYWTSWGVEPAS
jgi:hypothetical protein